MITRLRLFYQTHAFFLLLLILFVSFRLLALLLFRPGGFIVDTSDYDFYAVWGQLTAMGYHAYDNLWTAYPPLFPALMLPVFELSSQIPPWSEPRLFFHTLFGLLLLAFETGNLLLIYRLAMKLERGIGDRGLGIGDRRLGIRDRGLGIRDWDGVQTGEGFQSSDAKQNLTPLSPPIGPSSAPHAMILPLRFLSPLLYTLLFTPVYTMLGWFEPMPLFFMLLGMDFLLTRLKGGWVLSAIAAALGFLVKLTPILLVPIAIRWLGSKLSWRAARTEWFRLGTEGNLLRATIYTVLFFAVVIAIGYPLVRANPNLIFSSFQVQSIRPPWQSIWALLDGYWGYGVVPVDMRNLIALDTRIWPTQLPWFWITTGFIVCYLGLYTRNYDWQHPRTPIAFAAVSVIWLFLYSKGWSPQFLVWILAFMVLLLPTLRGMIIATVLALVNVIETSIYLILLPNEQWLLWGTVLLRTILLVLLALEFLGQIWPRATVGQQLRRVSAILTWLAILVGLAGATWMAPSAARAYQERRQTEHPCRAAVEYLETQAEWPNRTIASEQIEIWREFYPWLRTQYDFQVIDNYSPTDEPPADVVARKLETLSELGEFWWVEWADPAKGERQLLTAADYFDRPHAHLIERQQLGECIVQRVVSIPDRDASLAVANVSGGPILLNLAITDHAQLGTDFHLVLYWQAVAAVEESYTVFTQLLDENGRLVAQKDNLPVAGLAPTNTWAPGTLIRDAYRLAIPADIQPGSYRLLVGLYTNAGRQLLILPDGTASEHWELEVEIR